MRSVCAQAVEKNDCYLSVVIPVFNESKVLPVLYQRLRSALQELGLSHEVVFIDDGSDDGGAEYLQLLAAKDSALRILRLARNFGKEAALTAGLDHARGQAVVVMDADLQDPPELIKDMLDAFHQGYDVVTMKRRTRHGEGRFKRLSAYLYYRLLNKMSRFDIPEDTGDFRLLSRPALQALQCLPERNRYMKGLFAWIGMRSHIIEYDRAVRAAGETKWGFLKLLGLALEGITSFSIAPLRLAIAVGSVGALTGAVFGGWIVLKTMLFGTAVAGYPSIIALMTLLGGIQLLSIGLLGEYVGKTYLESKQRPLYVVRDNFSPEERVASCQNAVAGEVERVAK